jgi:hypothetical protein
LPAVGEQRRAAFAEKQATLVELSEERYQLRGRAALVRCRVPDFGDQFAVRDVEVFVRHSFRIARRFSAALDAASSTIAAI